MSDNLQPDRRISIKKLPDIRQDVAKESVTFTILNELQQLTDDTWFDNIRIIFEGGIGVGKTTIADEYGKAMKKSQIMPASIKVVLETPNQLEHVGGVNLIQAKYDRQITANDFCNAYLMSRPQLQTDAQCVIFDKIDFISAIAFAEFETQDKFVLKQLMQAIRFREATRRYQSVFTGSFVVLHFMELALTQQIHQINRRGRSYEKQLTSDEVSRLNEAVTEKAVFRYYPEFIKRCGAKAMIIVHSKNSQLHKIYFNKDLQDEYQWKVINIEAFDKEQIDEWLSTRRNVIFSPIPTVQE